MSRDVAVRNALAYAVPELFWGFGWAVAIDNPMPAAFADGFGASEGLVGSFGLCSAIGLGAPMLFTAFLLAPWRRKRGLLFWGHLAPAILLGVLALAVPPAAASGASVLEALYLGAFLVFFLSIGILVPAWLSLLGDLFPDHQRTRVLGVCFALNRVGGFVGGLVVERLLSSSELAPEAQWSWLFGLASLAMMLGSVGFLFIVEEERTPVPRPPIGRYLRSVLALFRELTTLRAFILVDVLAVTGMIVVMFYGDVAIRDHAIDASWAGVWTRAAAGTQFAVALAITFLGYRVAPRRWLVGGTLAIAGAAFLASVTTSPYGFTGVAAASGAFLVIRMTCHSPQVLRLSPGRDGTTPIALAWTATMPVQGIGPFAAGWLMSAGVLDYRPIFLGVGCLCLVGASLLWSRIPDSSR